MNEILNRAIQEQKAISEWGKIEGERLVLACEWKMRYQNCSSFWKKVILWIAPKSLFILTPLPRYLNQNKL